MPTESMDLKRVSKLLRHNIRHSNLPQPEEPCFMPYYDNRRGTWTAVLGTNYAGWFEAEAVEQVFLGEHFNTFRGLLSYMERALTEHQN